MKKLSRVSLLFVFFMLLPAQLSLAQTASCNISGGADWYSYAYEVCGGSFNIDVTETIFHDAIHYTVNAGPFCANASPTSVYPDDIYGRQWVTMTITTTDDPDIILAQCEYEHIHSRAAAVELVLDKSGSMGAGTKLQQAKTAAEAFIDTITPLVTVRPGYPLQWQHYGVVLYNQTAEYLDIEPLIPPGDIFYEVPSDTTNERVVEWLERVAAGGTTSIGAGLQLARSALETNVTTDEEPYERPAILVLSDGMENTAPWISEELPALQSLGFPVYSIGFGEDYQIDALKLQNLSNATGGEYRHTNDPDDLSNFFMKVLVDNYANIHMLLDPKGTVSAGMPQSYPFSVTEADKAITVVLTWRDPAHDLGLELSAPPLTVSETNRPARAKAIDRKLAYKIYSVPVCQTSTEQGCARPGDWSVNITAPSSVSESYSLTVLTHSDAQLGIGLPFGTVYTGEVLPISTQLMVDSKPVDNATIKVSLSAPNENAYHRIASAKLDATLLSKLSSVDGKRLWREKKAALVYDGKPIPRKRYEFTLSPQKADKNRSAHYLSRFKETQHPGSYDLTIRAEWETPKGHTLVREATRTIYIAAKPTESSKIAVKELSKKTKTRTHVVRINFTPIDSSGQLIGLGLEDEMQLTSPYNVLGVFKDLGNGTYRLETELPVGWKVLRLAMRGTVWQVKIP
jgi:hypothetical protein